MVVAAWNDKMDYRQVRSTFAGLAICLATLLATFAGCSWTQPRTDLAKVYNEVAQAPDYVRNPVIVIPGILGSRLRDMKTNKVVWGNFDRASANPNTPEGMRLVALPMAKGVPLSMLHDHVVADGPLDQLRIRLLGIPLRINAYAQILQALGVGGYRDQHFQGKADIKYDSKHFTCFQFDYDWRRDVSENAALLHRFIVEKRKYIQEQYRIHYGLENADVKFDIVAHSMGGLLARYYLRYGPQVLPDDGSMPKLTWEGSVFVERAVLVGTPNAGSAEALLQLLRGNRLAPLLPTYPAAVLGTMPAVYQLLPRPRHGAVVDAAHPEHKLDCYDPNLWRDMKWGLAAPAQAHVLKAILPEVDDPDTRLHIALDHQQKCLLRARQLHQSLDLSAPPPRGLTLHLFAGDALKTDEVIAVNLSNGHAKVIRKAPGDGVVTRTSAVFVENVMAPGGLMRVYPIPWTTKMFLPTDHLNLTRDRIFVDNVLSLLLESRSTKALPSPPPQIIER